MYTIALNEVINNCLNYANTCNWHEAQICLNCLVDYMDIAQGNKTSTIL